MSILNINTPNSGTVSINDAGVPEVCPNNPAGNALTVKNRSPIGYSAIEFQDDAGAARSWVGHGNAGSGCPNESYIVFAGCDYVISTFDGVSKKESIRLGGNGDVVLGRAGMQPDSNAGHVFIPYCLGAPTADSTADHSGHVPMIVDIENERIYVRVGNVWKSAQLV